VISLKISKIYTGMQFLFFPIIRPVEKIMKLLQRREEGEKITDEEIEAFIDLGKDS
jgi:CBS domain containing-hemolysin-like protein